MLVEFVLNWLCGLRPKRYLDVGASHPFHFSNTALLYQAGGQGILVEPDPYYANLLRKKRPRDTVLQCGVHFSGADQADFFVMDSPTLNTFSQEKMQHYIAMGHLLTRTLTVELKDINDIMDMAGNLDFLNIDIEGLDISILERMDWKRYRPTCICVETLTYETQQKPIKLNNIIELMSAHEYILYADTFINSIFIDNHQWLKKWERH